MPLIEIGTGVISTAHVDLGMIFRSVILNEFNMVR